MMHRNRSRVYFVLAVKTELIKIGVTMSTAARLAQLQGSSPDGLILLADIEASILEERELHRRFAALRARREWFHPGAELLDFLTGLPRGPGRPSARIDGWRLRPGDQVTFWDLQCRRCQFSWLALELFQSEQLPGACPCCGARDSAGTDLALIEVTEPDGKRKRQEP